MIRIKFYDGGGKGWGVTRGSGSTRSRPAPPRPRSRPRRRRAATTRTSSTPTWPCRRRSSGPSGRRHSRTSTNPRTCPSDHTSPADGPDRRTSCWDQRSSPCRGSTGRGSCAYMTRRSSPPSRPISWAASTSCPRRTCASASLDRFQYVAESRLHIKIHFRRARRAGLVH